MTIERWDTVVDVMRVPPEGDVGAALVAVATDGPVDTEACDVVVVGGGMGGVAAALTAAGAGKKVCLLEETDWLGGQLSSQGVSALDEHLHIEAFGGTATYYRLREALRDRYRQLTSPPSDDPALNPGNCWVTHLAFEPAIAVSVIDELLRPHITAGRLRVFLRTKAFAAEVDKNKIASVMAVNLEDGISRRFTGAIFVDATELGDLLPLTGTDYQLGAETRAETGEAHAQPEQAMPDCVQSFTYILGLERRPAGERHVIPPPTHYERFRQSQPYSLRIEVHGGEIYGEESGWLQYRTYERMPGTKGSLWDYRRLVDASGFPSYECDLSIINWPGNDYREFSILDKDPRAMAQSLQDAKRVSLGFLHWLQTEGEATAERNGAPELLLQPSIMGSNDGLSKYPYIREARRIKALKTIVEEEVSVDFQSGPRAAHFADSVGIGWYPIDIHRSGPEDVGISCRTRPFQIPLGAMLPRETINLVAACKNIGTTHITNGCYRLHPVEWNLGEVAGELAAYALNEAIPMNRVYNDSARLRAFQNRLLNRGVPIAWLIGIRPEETIFPTAQRLFMDGKLQASDSLFIDLEGPFDTEEWSSWGGHGDVPSTRRAALEALTQHRPLANRTQ